MVELNRLVLRIALDAWFTDALSYPGVTLLELTPEIAAESTQLPENFHRDPADQIIVATCRVMGCQLLTEDKKIRAYQHIDTP